LAAAIAVLGAARLAQYLGAFDFQVDQLLFAGKATRDYPPCEIAPITALGFIFCGWPCCCSTWKPAAAFSPAQAFILGIGLLALLGLTSYTYRAFSLYRAGSVMPMPLGTALGLGCGVSGHWQRARTEVSCR